MSWRVVLSSEARRDIEQVLDWTLDRFGQLKHDEYLQLIQSPLERIVENPLRVESRVTAGLKQGMRVLHIGRRGKKARHLFVHRIRPDNVIHVGRLLYDAMDLPRHIDEGFGNE
jgi:toxin ParE1/3/4